MQMDVIAATIAQNRCRDTTAVYVTLREYHKQGSAGSKHSPKSKTPKSGTSITPAGNDAASARQGSGSKPSKWDA